MSKGSQESDSKTVFLKVEIYAYDDNFRNVERVIFL